jgi:agmatinase
MTNSFIVKVPGINGLGKTKGCEKAGNAILDVLREFYSNEQGKEIDISKIDLEEIHLDNSNLELSNELIYKNSFDCFETKPKTIFLGGDHSVSYSLTRGFFDSCQNSGKKPCLIVFDAHPDLMPSMKEPTHEEWLRKLIDDGFPVENILLVGVRNSDKKELEFIKEKKIRVIDMNKIILDIENVCDTIMEFSSGKELYVSVDIDVIDPAFAPATGYNNEIGGLTSRQFLYLISRINKIKNLRAVDIVEINSEKDKEFNGMTVKLGAKILAELI